MSKYFDKFNNYFIDIHDANKRKSLVVALFVNHKSHEM